MSFIDKLVSRATLEWDFFGRDQGSADHYAVDAVDHSQKPKEQAQPFNDRVADYWLSISDSDYKRLMKAYKPSSGRLDGRLNIAWSAAFISYCMQHAGAGTEFPYSPGHATWIVASIRARNANKLAAPLVGYKPGEMEVNLGDLVGGGRGADAGITYDQASAKGWFLSHTDIVVEIDRINKKVRTIGGNVGQSVSRKEFPIDQNGKLTSSGLMVHIRNQISGKIVGAVSNISSLKVG